MANKYTIIERGSWNKGWTHLLSNKYYTNINGNKNVSFLVYNANKKRDNVTTNYISSNGWTFKNKFSWDTDFTHFAWYLNYLLAYSSKTGRAGIYRVNSNETGMDVIVKPWFWNPGWSHVVGLGKNFFFYNTKTGKMRYSYIVCDTSGKPVSINEGVDTRNWASDWTHFVPFDDPDHPGKRLLIFYNASNGRMMMDSYTCSPSKYTHTNLVDTYWYAGWRHIIPFTETFWRRKEFPKRHDATFLALVSDKGDKYQYVRISQNGILNLDAHFPNPPLWQNMMGFNDVLSWSSGYTDDMVDYSAPVLLAYNTFSGIYEIGKITIPFS